MQYDIKFITFVCVHSTVKPVNKGHPREIKIIVFFKDKRSLFGGFFILFNL